MLQGRTFLAQVKDVNTTRGVLTVQTMNLAQSVSIKMTGQRQHPTAGEYYYPELGDWGIITFLAEDSRSGYWLTSISDEGRNNFPLELLQSDPRANIVDFTGGQSVIQRSDGTMETVFPDGTFLKVTTTKDGSVGNTTARAARTPRKVTRTSKYGSPPTRETRPVKVQPPADIVLEHPSGAKVRITADGSFNLETARGHKLRLHDATERGRSTTTGAVTNAGESTARASSAVTITSEIGHSVTLFDDPIAAADRYISVRSSSGHEIKMVDKPDADKRITARTAAGHQLELRDTPAGNQYAWIKTAAGNVVEARDTPAAALGVKAQTVAGFKLELLDTPKIAKLSTPGGRSTLHDDTAALTTITDPVKVLVSSPLVALADGGPAVARVGDKVMVGGIIGTIIQGSSKTNSG